MALIGMGNFSKLMDKYWARRTVDFVLRKRFCDKHMREFIKKNNLQKRKDLNIVQLPSVCCQCHKGGICCYIEGDIM